jgi:hypothetical protein
LLSFEPELERLREAFGGARTDALIARERREVFSVYPEVRIAAWGGALLIATAVGLFVKNNFHLFDRVLIAVVLAAMALGCYLWAWRGGREAVNEYVLLLGALLLSADVGFIEQQFDVLGEAGARHFLWLAVIHGATAYRFHSKLVLSLSIASLAAWMGIEREAEVGIELALRAFACAAVILVWRALDRRVVQASGLPVGGGTEGRPEARTTRTFSRVFEHSAANLALWGGLLLMGDAHFTAALVTTTIAALVMAWGFRTRVEAFVLYAFVYAVIADIGYAMTLVDEELAILLGILVAVPALVLIHRRFKEAAP